MKRKREEVFCSEILLIIVFVFIGFVASGLGQQHLNYEGLGIVVEIAVIVGAILWMMQKNNKKYDLSSGSIKVRCFFTLIISKNRRKKSARSH